MSEEQMKAWLRNCYQEATLSPDPSTQIGSVIISQLGTVWPGTLCHNGPPKGWDLQPEDLVRPRKYSVIGHAERSSLHAAAARGWPMTDSTMVSTWAACTDCAHAIVGCGISTLIRHVPPSDDAVDRWFESVGFGDEILKGAGVEIVNVYGDIPGAPPILRGGELFHPGADYLFEFDRVDQPADAVFQALGAASVCWEFPERAGIFESCRAKAIGDALLKKLEEFGL